jgi:hypothetical protein
MDLGAFVQENKRWLLGAAVGGVVWWIASSVVQSVYKVRVPSARTLGAPAEAYDARALAAARQEHEQLLAERERLREALAFRQGDRFVLDGKGRADEYQFQVGRELRQAIATAANRRDVQVADSAIVWDVPTAYDEIRAVLFGLELIDEVQQRLFAAHDRTRALAEDAIGLRSIQSLRLESRRNQRQQARPRAGEIDLRDFLQQEQVAFAFQADEPTLLAFLESCRRPGRTLVVESWQVTKPPKPGEPCAVKGTVLGIAWKGEGGR